MEGGGVWRTRWVRGKMAIIFGKSFCTKIIRMVLRLKIHVCIYIFFYRSAINANILSILQNFALICLMVMWNQRKRKYEFSFIFGRRFMFLNYINCFKAYISVVTFQNIKYFKKSLSLPKNVIYLKYLSIKR